MESGVVMKPAISRGSLGPLLEELLLLLTPRVGLHYFTHRNILYTKHTNECKQTEVTTDDTMNISTLIAC